MLRSWWGTCGGVGSSQAEGRVGGVAAVQAQEGVWAAWRAGRSTGGPAGRLSAQAGLLALCRRHMQTEMLQPSFPARFSTGPATTCTTIVNASTHICLRLRQVMSALTSPRQVGDDARRPLLAALSACAGGHARSTVSVVSQAPRLLPQGSEGGLPCCKVSQTSTVAF